ncbi:MAG: preprotein translocase subunit SecE [Puniceicoccales bacterium]|nr:preprotein translocase subunit SecE [Puniceicoccales bacterium]
MAGTVKKFFSETVGELKKSVWPSRKELGRSTVVVVVGMFLIGFYISIVDFSLLNIVDFISKLVRG